MDDAASSADYPLPRVTVEPFPTLIPTSAPPDDALHPLTVLVLTIITAIVLSVVLLPRQQSGKRQRTPPPRTDEPEEYFQRILKDVKLDSWSGTEENYSWTQTDEEVEVIAPLPSGVRRARDVDRTAVSVYVTHVINCIRWLCVLRLGLYRQHLLAYGRAVALYARVTVCAGQHPPCWSQPPPILAESNFAISFVHVERGLGWMSTCF